MQNLCNRTTPTSHILTHIYVPGQKETLLSLPAEIRQRIWNFVYTVEPTYETVLCEICGSEPCQSRRVEIQHAPHKAATTSVLASLGTCKQIYSEAGHLFYSLNLLSLSSPAALYQFLSGLSARLRHNITALHVANVTPDHWTTTQIAKQAFSSLSLCSRLKELFVDFSIDMPTDSRMHLLLWACLPYHEALKDTYSGSSRHEFTTDESMFQKAFFALSQQRNIVRLSLRGRKKEFEGSNEDDKVEWARPYSYEDVILEELTITSVDTLRAQMQQSRPKPTTRFDRAQPPMRRNSSRGERHTHTCSVKPKYDSIRPMSTEEIQQVRDYHKQKALVRSIFDHENKEPLREDDGNNG